MDENLKKISGVVEGVIYKNAENGYIIFEIDNDGHLLTVVGNLGDILPGEKLILTGEYTTNPKYGEQFKADVCERSRPDTPEEIAKYLSSGIFPGVGVKTALQITQKFGEDTLDVIENTPERLREVKGITLDKAASIGAAFRRLCGVNNVLEFLGKYGISPATSVAVWNRYDTSSIALVKENPFLLCGEGIELDFRAVDRIAEEFGSSPFDLRRISAGITHVLYENARNGHTCMTVGELQSEVVSLLEISRDAFDAALQQGRDDKSFIWHESDKLTFIYLAVYYKAEQYIARKLTQMLKLNPGNNRDFSDEIAAVEEEEGITYETLQKAAIQACLEHNLFILTGGPGTGKTTTLNAVIRLLKNSRKLLTLAAPTGRAAKRMSELTGEPAKTIHRLLEVDPTADSSRGLSVFKRNEMNPLNADVVIIDEMSMVDALLFEALLRAIEPDTKLIMAGDSEQLPSVGAGNVLADLIACDKIHAVRLVEIFRQASESLIVTNAHKIVSGYMPVLDVRDKDFFFMPCENENGYGGAEDIAATVAGLVKTRLPAAYGYDPIEDIQVLTPTKLGFAGTRELNRLLQSEINPATVKKREARFGEVIFRDGDKVMQTVNDYNVEWKRGGERGMGIYNGDIGVITGFDKGGMYVNFDGRVALIESKSWNKIEHAYAITVHKSQGSEYKAVIMPMSEASRRLLYRSLLYTGVTRARDLLILVGRQATIAEMVSNECETNRHSCLCELILRGM
ncbi:MAG: ATP-dependent RecD-like DNA helicase [Oscillospiraceae bacterium]|nr:ATP-dependent RecD-like DNA helicase [Oscillospiraceae bacterium]